MDLFARLQMIVDKASEKAGVTLPPELGVALARGEGIVQDQNKPFTLYLVTRPLLNRANRGRDPGRRRQPTLVQLRYQNMRQPDRVLAAARKAVFDGAIPQLSGFPGKHLPLIQGASGGTINLGRELTRHMLGVPAHEVRWYPWTPATFPAGRYLYFVKEGRIQTYLTGQEGGKGHWFYLSGDYADLVDMRAVKEEVNSDFGSGRVFHGFDECPDILPPVRLNVRR